MTWSRACQSVGRVRREIAATRAAVFAAIAQIRRMRVDLADLWWFLGAACVAIALGAALSRTRARPLGWLVLAAGLGAVGLQALAQLTGRLGAEHLWFR